MSQTDIARPANPAPVSEADVYAAVRAFVMAYALPALAPENVVQGWQNRAALPPETNEYAVISILFDTQRGTAVEEYAWDRQAPEKTGSLAVKGLIEIAVQIDFCSEDDTARQRARRLATLTRSSVGVRFFHDWGMSALYADDARDISFVGDAKQFVRRWMTTLRLTITEGVSAEFEAFGRAAVSRLENVDVHHNPQKEQ
ncbi:MAG: hypothetical protein LBH65_04660 [Desulfovibrio sp.]|jgi:hypothetical protein|nr:hypothetical protein [Desulfovibrio sp.]